MYGDKTAMNVVRLQAPWVDVEDHIAHFDFTGEASDCAAMRAVRTLYAQSAPLCLLTGKRLLPCGFAAERFDDIR